MYFLQLIFIKLINENENFHNRKCRKKKALRRVIKLLMDLETEIKKVSGLHTPFEIPSILV